jgi:hypothetical protein
LKPQSAFEDEGADADDMVGDGDADDMVGDGGLGDAIANLEQKAHFNVGSDVFSI